jgi:uncharacterized protein YegJ (DUF2314 family)
MVETYDMRHNGPMLMRITILLAPLTLATFLSGCADQRESEPSPHEARPRPSQWSQQNGSHVVAVPGEARDAQLAAAIAQARATAPDARLRWLGSSPEERQRWAVKWAAPTTGDSIEHVWVRPVNWTRFRIEGVLATQPINELAGGKSLGELVSFPIDELSDWALFASSNGGMNFQRTIDGGFTMRLLEERYGRPE